MATERIDIVVSETGSRTVSRNIKGVGESADGAGRKVGFFGSELKKLVLVGGSVAATFLAAAGAAIRFQDALAEVSTLVDTAVFDMDRLAASALENAALFGTGPAQQAQAYYQVISAGASTAAEAQTILTAANKLAVGGVTDIKTATDGLTSVLNAYGDKVEGATAVSDAMFVAMKAGKTTIGELSSSLGKVAPLAATAGVSFDELLASVSALTKGGINTREAVTGVRAIMAAIVKPTQEASSVAQQLGIDFSAAALESKGFAGFLQDIIDKSGGNTEVLAQLFGGVEALVPILALTGAAGEDFNQILEDMKAKGGAAEEAFNKIANSPGFQARRVYGAMAAEAAKLGSVIAKALVPAMRFLADNAATIVSVLKIAAAATIAYYTANATMAAVIKVQAIPSLLALEKALGATSTKQAALAVFSKTTFARSLGVATTGVRALTVALLANPIGAIVALVVGAAAALFLFGDKIKISEDGVVSLLDIFRALFSFIVEAVQPVAEFFGNVWASATGKVVEGFDGFGAKVGQVLGGVFNAAKTLVNGYIGLWVGAYKVITTQWDRFPKVVGDLAISAVNLTISAVEDMINNVLKGINLVIGAAESVGKFFTPKKFEKDFEGVGEITLGRISNKYKHQAEILGISIVDIMGNAVKEDYVEGIAGGILDRARSIAEDRNGKKTTEPTTPVITPPTPQATGPTLDGLQFADILKDLREEQELLQLSSRERERRIELLQIEDSLGRQLTDQERQQAEVEILRLQTMRDEARVREELVEQQIYEMNELQVRQDVLNQAMEEGAISAGNYANQIRDLNIATLQLKVDMGDGTFSDGFLLGLAKMTKGAQNWKASVGGIFSNFFESFTDGFANSVGRAIVYSENLGQALKDVAKQALAQLIGALIKLGIQALLNATLGSAIQSAATAASVAQAAAVTAAWTPAAIAVSLASFGANSAPAAAGFGLVTAAAKATQALAAGFMEGGYTGNSATTAIAGVVHGQEYVFDAEATRRIGVSNLERLRSGGELKSVPATQQGINTSSAEGGSTNVEVNMQIAIDNKSGAQTPEEIGEAIGEQARKQIIQIIDTRLVKQSKNGGLLKARSV